MPEAPQEEMRGTLGELQLSIRNSKLLHDRARGGGTRVTVADLGRGRFDGFVGIERRIRGGMMIDAPIAAGVPRLLAVKQQSMPCEDLSVTEAQVRAARDGDAEALAKLFGRYLPRVRRIVACRTGRTVRALADLEDIVQETFADAVAGIRQFNHSSDGTFCNWIAQCVENNIRDVLRRGIAQKRGRGTVRKFADLEESTMHESIFAGDGPSPSQQAQGNELEERIEDALLRLSPRHRRVIELRAYCRMSYGEITATMGLRTVNTATLLFMRARDKLSKMIGT